MPQISQIFGNVVVAHLPMITFLSAIVFFISFRIRSRTSLELDVIALRHQLGVLKRQRPGRARFFFADRLLWIWLCRIHGELLKLASLSRRPQARPPHGLASASCDPAACHCQLSEIQEAHEALGG
jgi:hypothetical protein